MYNHGRLLSYNVIPQVSETSGWQIENYTPINLEGLNISYHGCKHGCINVTCQLVTRSNMGLSTKHAWVGVLTRKVTLCLLSCSCHMPAVCIGHALTFECDGSQQYTMLTDAFCEHTSVDAKLTLQGEK